MLCEFLYNADGIGSHCHSGSLVEHNGIVYASWYGYEEKEYDKGQICLSSFDPKSGTWSKSKKIFQGLSNSSCGNPVLFSDPENKSLHLFFVILQRHYWDSAQIYHSSLKDGEVAWSSPEKMNLPMGLMIRHRPIIKSPGVFIIPAYDEKENKSIMYESQYPYNNWAEIGSVSGELIQGDLLKFNDKEWQVMLRPSGDTPHFIFKALSPDGCKNFNTILRTIMPCPLSGLAAIKLQSGHVLVCHNHTENFERTPLTLSIARKGENFYNKLLDVDSGPIEISYPTLLQQDNGTIHLLYTYNRKMMKHIIFDKKEMEEYGL